MLRTMGPPSIRRLANNTRPSLAYCWCCATAMAAISSTTSTAGAFSVKPVCGSMMPRYHSSFKRTPEEVMMTDDALAILRKAIDAVNPFNAVQAHLKLGGDEDGLSLTAGTYRYQASDVNDVLLVAFGKASSAMASSAVRRLEQAFPGKPIRGVVVVKDDHAAMEEMEVLQRHAIQVLEAAHPVPDRRSVQAAQQIMTLANEASAQTLVICCISGGGSALFCAPRPPLTLQDLQATNSALLKSGMSIHEMNVIRKRLETGKGGLLAAAAYPAQVLTLVLSDILGDPLDLIASGPTVPDPSTFRDALQLVHANNLDTVLPASVMSVLVKGLEDSSEDTPKGDSPVFERCNTVLVGNNELAVLAAADEASSRGYDPVILGTMMEGEARNVAGVYTAMVQHLKRGGKYPMSRLPSALIAGGETTVTIGNESGKGGRNQELALVAAQQLQALKLRDVVLASVGTDGTDGPTDAAGAVVDGATVDRLTGSVGDALGRHDAYTYLDQVDDEGHSPLIRTGPTGTNVADVCVILIK